ncbi:hypothetical protein DES36_110113 [Alkalibaculum bacchi]|uniref:Uncharacterized protein n=1 Tax=Alkalibaculum bacchi TaxID=645887 RepID=A0A366I550_9FIRM|nr:hypothetical protein [Alkalibaculum bacchi]RBP63369.1 hypothetical protein DES36_110113 [Alkalibaculum bacchi]
MATWKDDNEKMNLTLRQVLKQIEHVYDPNFDLWNDYVLNDEFSTDNEE